MSYDEEYAKKLEVTSGSDKLVTTDGSIIPEEKVKQMQDYAKRLLKNSPKMKPERLKRKVAEHFKIKLV